MISINLFTQSILGNIILRSSVDAQAKMFAMAMAAVVFYAVVAIIKGVNQRNKNRKNKNE